MRQILNRKGFTLIELIVVVAILGILAAVAAPRVINSVNDARVSAVKANMETVKGALNSYVAQTGKLPGDTGATKTAAQVDDLLSGKTLTQLGVTYTHTADTASYTLVAVTNVAPYNLGETYRTAANFPAPFDLTALDESQSDLKPYLKGPMAATFVDGDYTVVLKEMSAFAKTHDELKFKGGWVEARAFNGAQMAELATIPPREVLLSMLVSVMNGPLSQLVGTLQAVPRDLVLTLMSLAEQRGGGEAAEAAAG